jgi:hypothetical protein
MILRGLVACLGYISKRELGEPGAKTAGDKAHTDLPTKLSHLPRPIPLLRHDPSTTASQLSRHSCSNVERHLYHASDRQVLKFADAKALLPAHTLFHMATSLALARRVPEGAWVGHLRRGHRPNASEPYGAG